jgi:hypothetical protein
MASLQRLNLAGAWRMARRRADGRSLEMLRERRRLGVVGSIVLVVAACSIGAPSPTPMPAATSFGEYRTAFCLSWEALFRAVGNPDTGQGSELSDAMDDAIARNEFGQADVLAARIKAELEAGRRQVEFAGGFAPGAAMMVETDRFFIAYEAMIEAKRAAAREGLTAATDKGQAAFEAAGGLDAWRAMMLPETWSALDAARPPGEEQQTCENVPIGI